MVAAAPIATAVTTMSAPLGDDFKSLDESLKAIRQRERIAVRKSRSYRVTLKWCFALWRLLYGSAEAPALSKLNLGLVKMQWSMRLVKSHLLFLAARLLAEHGSSFGAFG